MRTTDARTRGSLLANLILLGLVLGILTGLAALSPSARADTAGSPTGTTAPEVGRVLVYRPGGVRLTRVDRVSIGRCRVDLTCVAHVYGARDGWVQVRDYLAAGGTRARFAQTPCMGEDVTGCTWSGRHAYWQILTGRSSVCIVFKAPLYDLRHGYCTRRSTGA